MTALHLGVSGRHVETVKELAENADPHALNAIDSVSIKPYCILSRYVLPFSSHKKVHIK